MNFKEFMNALDGEVKNVYLLSGEETFFIDKARDKIFERLNVDKSTELMTLEYDTKNSIGEIISAIDSAPFFGSKNVVLVKNAVFFSSEKKFERLENILSDMQPNNYVIFTAKTVDKRRKLYKIISKTGLALEAELLRPWEINDWLNLKLSSLGKFMSAAARQYFDELLRILPEISLWYLENELDKVALNVTGAEITAADLRKNMLAPPEVSNFALTDAIDERKLKKALYLLRMQTSRNFGKIPIVTTLLVNHIRNLLRAKFFVAEGLSGYRLAEALEMKNFIAKKTVEASQNYREKFLEEILIELAEADFKLKTGRADVEILERIIVKLCKR